MGDFEKQNKITEILTRIHKKNIEEELTADEKAERDAAWEQYDREQADMFYAPSEGYGYSREINL